MNLGFYKANISIISTKSNSFFLPKAYNNYIKASSDMEEDGITTRYIINIKKKKKKNNIVL